MKEFYAEIEEFLNTSKRGPRRKPFVERVLAKAVKTNLRFHTWSETSTFPQNVEEYLDFDATLEDGRTFNFDLFKEFIYIAESAECFIKVNEVKFVIGYAAVNQETKDPKALIQVRATLPQDYRAFVNMSGQATRPVSEFTLDEFKAELYSADGTYAKLTTAERHMFYDFAQVVHQARLRLIAKANSSDSQPVKQKAIQERKRKLMTKHLADFNSQEDNNYIEVGGFMIYMLMLLEQTRLVSLMLEEYGAKITGRLLEFALMQVVQRDFRPNQDMHTLWCSDNLSLSRRPINTHFYVETYRLFVTDYLGKEKAREKGLIYNGQSVLDSYILLNQRAFRRQQPHLDKVQFNMDGTSVKCKSKKIAEAVYGIYGASKENCLNIKEFTFHEAQTGYVLYHRFYAGNINDFTKTADALRSDLMKSLGFNVDLSQITFVGDRGCSSREILGLLLVWKCQFILFTKADSTEFKKIKRATVADYHATYETLGYHAHLPIDLNEEESARLAKSVGDAAEALDAYPKLIPKLTTAAEMGICSKMQGLIKNPSASAQDKQNELGQSIDPQTQILAVVLPPKSPRLADAILLHEWGKAHQKLIKLNKGEPNQPSREEPYLIGFTIDQLLDLTGDQAASASVTKYYEQVQQAAHANMHSDDEGWKVELAKAGRPGLIRKNAKATELDKLISDEDLVHQYFCYGISRKEFLSFPFNTAYKLMLMRWDVDFNGFSEAQRPKKLRNYALKGRMHYSARQHIEVFYRGNKRVDGESVFVSSLESYAVRRITTYIAQQIHHLIHRRYIEQARYLETEANKNQPLSIPSIATVHKLLNSTKIKVHYKSGKVNIASANTPSSDLKNLLATLRLEELTNVHLQAYLSLFWSEPVRDNSITKLNLKSYSDEKFSELTKFYDGAEPSLEEVLDEEEQLQVEVPSGYFLSVTDDKQSQRTESDNQNASKASDSNSEVPTDSEDGTSDLCTTSLNNGDVFGYFYSNKWLVEGYEDIRSAAKYRATPDNFVESLREAIKEQEEAETKKESATKKRKKQAELGYTRLPPEVVQKMLQAGHLTAEQAKTLTTEPGMC